MDAKERKSKEYSILLLESARQHHGVDYDPHEKVFNKSDIQAAYEVGWDAAKQELLKGFREHFCDAYCQYFGNDDYCRCCPIKDENCWLNGDDNNGTTNCSEKLDSPK